MFLVRSMVSKVVVYIDPGQKLIEGISHPFKDVTVLATKPVILKFEL